ncbi:hypothetical protein EI427_11435 [Flammeovirga pectinis]|uniref:Uncharacterized protein n=1 Tax=Flammeovirga pectinis TaxID=2494373 RepID=A0A3Q9FR54_9BACT|nr:hypothetical protein [Flammeovirga pectinis]AZQ62823.1 hypothetical protein EI427_11435 [Flammeovirga pectinis]
MSYVNVLRKKRLLENYSDYLQKEIDELKKSVGDTLVELSKVRPSNLETVQQNLFQTEDLLEEFKVLKEANNRALENINIIMSKNYANDN